MFFEALSPTDVEGEKTKIRPNGEIKLNGESVGRFSWVELRACF